MEDLEFHSHGTDYLLDEVHSSITCDLKGYLIPGNDLFIQEPCHT